MKVAGDLAHRLELVGLDLREAHAADRMLFEMTRDGRLARFDHLDARFGLKYIEEALARRLALAVDRLLQVTRKDRAGFAALLSLITCPDERAKFGARLDVLRNCDAARKVRECRNGFIAHTLVGKLGSRDGMGLSPLSELLYKLTTLYEEIHPAVIGPEDRAVSEDLEKWRARARETWNTLLGIEDADEDLLA
jgi:hypothetical protein